MAKFEFFQRRKTAVSDQSLRILHQESFVYCGFTGDFGSFIDRLVH